MFVFTFEINPNRTVNYEIVPEGGNSIYPQRVSIEDSPNNPVIVWLDRSILLITRVTQYGDITTTSTLDGRYSDDQYVQEYDVVDIPDRQDPNIVTHRLDRLIRDHLPMNRFDRFEYNVYTDLHRAFHLIFGNPTDTATSQPYTPRGTIYQLISNRNTMGTTFVLIYNPNTNLINLINMTINRIEDTVTPEQSYVSRIVIPLRSDQYYLRRLRIWTEQHNQSSIESRLSQISLSVGDRYQSRKHDRSDVSELPRVSREEFQQYDQEGLVARIDPSPEGRKVTLIDGREFII